MSSQFLHLNFLSYVSHFHRCHRWQRTSTRSSCPRYTFYNGYLCLVASNKQQIQWTAIQRNWINEENLSKCGLLQRRSSYRNKSVLIVQELAFDAVR